MRAHIWVMYAAARASVWAGLVAPTPPPADWLDEGSRWPPLTSDACSPVSFLLASYRAVMALQCFYFVVQVPPPPAPLLTAHAPAS